MVLPVKTDIPNTPLNPGLSRDRDTGFTLLEMLVALAILSLTSLAMFQSIGTLLQVSEKAITASERTIDKTLDRITLISLISGIVPHWDDAPNTAFRGSGTEMSGVSTLNPGFDAQGLTAFSLRLVAKPGSQTHTLVYSSHEASLDLASDIPLSARFNYVGLDANPRNSWPPDAPISNSFFNQEGFETLPVLPNIVSLTLPDGQVIWTIAITKYFNLPNQPSLISENDNL